VAQDNGFPEAEFLRLLPRIERTCRFIAGRYGLLGADAEDFTSHVKLRLIEGDYDILRKFEARARIETYLVTVIDNLARDYRISLTGKWRPCAAARRLGAIAMTLDRLLFRDRHTLDEAWEIMTTNHRLDVSRADLERLAEQLPPHSVRQFISEEGLAGVAASDAAPDAALLEVEGRSHTARVREVLQEVKAALAPQDQVILAMRYEDGVKIVDIAAALGIEQRLLYRRLDGLHTRLRREVEARGISTEILEWFETQA
jgi:RNA polymerase sigma factor (sigma-70 family)